MKLLIDTHALLWFWEGSDALSGRARAALEDTSNERYVSHVSAWEVAIKLSLGKMKLGVSFDVLFPGAVSSNGFFLLQSEIRHYGALLELPFHHRDPFDRLLIAQAKVEGLTIVTADEQMGAYDVPLLW